MVNNVYTIDLIAQSVGTTTISDDGSGVDWLIFAGNSQDVTTINLSHSTNQTTSTSASAHYTSLQTSLPPIGTIVVAHDLIVNGLIERARGTNGRDNISGNEQNNVLYGDRSQTSAGGNDTLFGFAGNDIIFGGKGNDEIYGHSGNDWLEGDAGNDTIDGGIGNDSIIGGAGADSLSGGWDARDKLSYAGSNAGIEITLSRTGATTGIGGFAEGDSILGFADVVGSSHDDVITAISATGLANGFADNRFYGGAGNDFLSMGDGNDRGYGGDGGDWIVLSGGADYGYGDAGNDRLDGGNGNDTLYGGAGNDTLIGDGNDTLSTGNGVDHLFGGLGADHFFFSDQPNLVTPEPRDAIHDFSRAQGDTIDLWAMDADAPLTGHQDFTWRGALGFSGTHGELRVFNSGANTTVLADLNGDRVADFSILVLGINNMTVNDFVLFLPI